MVSTVILTSWSGVAHLLEAPPGLLYGDLQFMTLHVWEADCETIFSVCQHERPLLEGLYVHPVAQPSPDGEYIAVYMMDGWMVYGMDCLLSGGECSPTPLDPLTMDIRAAWRSDGSEIGYFTGNPGTTLSFRRSGCWDRIAVLDCFTESVSLGAERVFREVAWSADGSTFAFVGVIPRGLYVLDAACLDIPHSCIDQYRLIPVSSGTPHWPSFSPDGRQLLYYEQNVNGVEQLFIVDLDSLHVRRLTVKGSGHVPAWSGDGRYIAYTGFENLADGDTDIYILDLQRKITVQVVSEPGIDFNYPSWSPRR
jgi:hypothetical protein